MIIRTLQPAVASIPQSLREAAAVLGAPPWKVWLAIDLPVLARSTIVCAVFGFTISLGEFGATSLINRPEYPTMPIATFRYLSLPGALNYGQAMAMATLLMAFCALGILLIDMLSSP